MDPDLRPGEMLLTAGQTKRLFDMIKNAPKIPEGREIRELPHAIVYGWVIPIAMIIAGIVALFLLT